MFADTGFKAFQSPNMANLYVKIPVVYYFQPDQKIYEFLSRLLKAIDFRKISHNYHSIEIIETRIDQNSGSLEYYLLLELNTSNPDSAHLSLRNFTDMLDSFFTQLTENIREKCTYHNKVYL